MTVLGSGFPRPTRDEVEVRTDLPHSVRVVEHTMIPTRDGTKLAARLWIPEGAEDAPVPVILEYIPYRKRDKTRVRDDRNHMYFAGHGYACARVDIRGSGDSEGILEDEYLQVELDDAVDLLAWFAEQPWCDGRAGMFGKSWGGFNGLQVASMQPPELQAVISVCSTDDRYSDDVHFMGGCLLGDNLSWASSMFAYNSLPPDPELAGERWREEWFRRIDGSGLWIEKWLAHQRRDAYWQHGSVCEDYSRVRTPVLLVSGWADGYSNAVFRMLEHLECPRLGLVGPWSHKYPHLGQPGPAIGFLQECLRFWDQHLKGIDTGIMDEPMVRAWMQDSVPPTTRYEERPGRWVGEPSWPTPNVRLRRYSLSHRHLTPEEEPAEEDAPPLTIDSPLSHGLFAGKWCSYAATPDLPPDQRQEDGSALIFTSQPLVETLEILGAPEVELSLRADQPVAQVAVRLSDVRPDGATTRVSYGILNLTHRDSHEEPAPLEPGERYRVRVHLNEVAQTFPAGHRVRLAVATSYFPLAWPSPRRATLTLETRESSLFLPVREPRREDREIEFGPPVSAPPASMVLLEPTDANWIVTRDLGADEAWLDVLKHDGLHRMEAIDLELGGETKERYRFARGDYQSVRGETTHEHVLRRGDWEVRTVTHTVLTATEDHFHVHATLDAYEGGRRVRSRIWNRRIPRDLV